MKYRPHWQRILFLAAVFNLILFFASAAIFVTPETQIAPPDNLQEIEWVETSSAALPEFSQEISTAETFPEIVLPPLEIQHTVFEPLPKLDLNQPPPPLPQPVETEKVEEKITPPPVEEKKSEKPEDKLKVIVKVFPKDLIDQLIFGGVSKEKISWQGEKIILSATITVEGKVRNAEIIGGATGRIIDTLAITAAQSCIFEPYLDENGNPQELKTQIEFTKEDF